LREKVGTGFSHQQCDNKDALREKVNTGFSHQQCGNKHSDARACFDARPGAAFLPRPNPPIV
jgi:hypothetical protein